MISIQRIVAVSMPGKSGMNLSTSVLGALAAVFLGVSTPALAQDVFITPEIPFVEFDNGSEYIFIERNQDPEARIPDFFTKTSRNCPAFCVQPMSAGEGVETVGELEVLEFLEEHVAKGTGALIDARLTEWYERGSIPGAINLSFTVFENPETNPFLAPVVQLLGGVLLEDETWDFADAMELAVFCNGPWCGQSHRAIENLLTIGYPAERIRYYRGGMQGWLSLGLTTVTPAGS